VDIAVRGVCLYLFIVLLMRVTGRRELSSLEPIDLVLLIVAGDLVQQGVTQDDFTVTGAVIALSTIATMQVAISYLGFRSRWARRALDGDPIVLVQDGRVLDQNLRRERLTLEELAKQARGQQIASIEDVQWAVFEPSGTISFIPKKQ
jgi:uncharacterized membrane protein YcaP (DUF421 family)